MKSFSERNPTLPQIDPDNISSHMGDPLEVVTHVSFQRYHELPSLLRPHQLPLETLLELDDGLSRHNGFGSVDASAACALDVTYALAAQGQKNSAHREFDYAKEQAWQAYELSEEKPNDVHFFRTLAKFVGLQYHDDAEILGGTQSVDFRKHMYAEVQTEVLNPLQEFMDEIELPKAEEFRMYNLRDTLIGLQAFNRLQARHADPRWGLALANNRENPPDYPTREEAFTDPNRYDFRIVFSDQTFVPIRMAQPVKRRSRVWRAVSNPAISEVRMSEICSRHADRWTVVHAFRREVAGEELSSRMEKLLDKVTDVALRAVGSAERIGGGTYPPDNVRSAFAASAYQSLTKGYRPDPGSTDCNN